MRTALLAVAAFLTSVFAFAADITGRPSLQRDRLTIKWINTAEVHALVRFSVSFDHKCSAQNSTWQRFDRVDFNIYVNADSENQKFIYYSACSGKTAVKDVVVKIISAREAN